MSDYFNAEKNKKDAPLKLVALAAAMTGAMATWFAGTAILPEITGIWQLNDMETSLITMMVQAGFVAGALLSAFLNLPDRILPNQLFFWSACLAGGTTILVVYLPSVLSIILLCRFMTGMALAGVYGPGLKLASSWFRKGRGMALGAVVGALTLGSAAPHLFRISAAASWETVLFLAGICSILAGILVKGMVPPGPHHSKSGGFNPRAIPLVLKNKSVRLANYGYFGHSWELYAMWTWLALFLTNSFKESGQESPSILASALTFIIIGSGSLGAWAGGILADRIGRETLAMGALGISGTMTFIIGFLYGAPAWLIAIAGMVWGITIIADSAQFSALVTEHADPRYIGSALTFQLAVGYALTIIIIWLTAWIQAWIGWQFAFLLLLPGPLLAFLSMVTLKRRLKNDA
ncbi:MFS transporter [Salibacterium aidingense]|uniref:MFS transporter n=1 Tax=Salibacterium aidingense TaxID=384933 RepID=UPI0004079646|nr:MFS transporter [Salibacterium aidingense]